MKRIAVTLLVLAIASSAFAQANLPPGKWWRRPEIVQILSLSEEQQEKLETIFRNASSDLIDLRGEVEKQNINLHGELDQQQLDRAVIRRDAQKLSDARGRLFERELTMLVDMRAVLNDSQWNRMRNGLLDRLGNAGQQQRPKANGGGMRKQR
ncbi:MAG TPA: periplasmic heavy metal sensor [Thermoanaerobaculia bacterium]|nr:periplasmic heavy metal sensor [Thermoanaerobaculia bacterium]